MASNGLSRAFSLLFGNIRPIAKMLITEGQETYVSERFLIHNDNARIHIIVDTKVNAHSAAALNSLSAEDLQRLLDSAIQKEDYDAAAKINEALERLDDHPE